MSSAGLFLRLRGIAINSVWTVAVDICDRGPGCNGVEIRKSRNWPCKKSMVSRRLTHPSGVIHSLITSGNLVLNPSPCWDSNTECLNFHGVTSLSWLKRTQPQFVGDVEGCQPTISPCRFRLSYFDSFGPFNANGQPAVAHLVSMAESRSRVFSKSFQRFNYFESLIGF